MDDNGTRGTWEFLSGEEVFNVEGDQSVVPGEGAVGFLLPLRSHAGRGSRVAAATATTEGEGQPKVGAGGGRMVGRGRRKLVMTGGHGGRLRLTERSENAVSTLIIIPRKPRPVSPPRQIHSPLPTQLPLLVFRLYHIQIKRLSKDRMVFGPAIEGQESGKR